MKSLYKDQKQEIDKAYEGIRDYKLSSPYLSYGVQAKDCFEKSQKQSSHALFGKARLSPAEHDVGTSANGTDEKNPFTDKRDTASGPSTSIPLQCSTLTTSVYQSTQAKVRSSFEDDSSYSKCPGVNDYTSSLVKSSSSERLHFVTKEGCSYKCDSDCLMFKSTKGLCSHSLLAESLNSDFENFVAHYVKTKDPINYTALGYQQVTRNPAYRGRLLNICILAAANHICRTKWASKGPVAFLSTGDSVHFSLFHCSRPRQFPKWCHGKHSKFSLLPHHCCISPQNR